MAAKKLKSLIHFLLNSVSTKVILVMLVVILPFNIFTIVLSNMSVKNVTAQAKLSVQNVMQNYLTDMKERMDNATSLLYIMRQGNSDDRILRQQAGDDAYDSAKYKFLYDYKKTVGVSKSASGVFLYMEKLDDLLIWHQDTSIHLTDDMKRHVRQLLLADMPLGWHKYMVPASRELQREYPVLMFCMELDDMISGGWIELESIVQKLERDIAYEDKEIFFSDMLPIEDENYLIVSSYFEKADIYLNTKISQKELNGSVLFVSSAMQKISFSALLLIPLLYLLFSRLLMSPLKTVNRAHDALRNGNADYRITQKAKSIEFQLVYNSFNEMSQNLKDLTIENYEKEIEKQKILLKNLQLQIRPHFLINVFNLIFTLAQEKDVSHIQDVMLYLSDYFRYMFRSNKDLEMFAKEEKLIKGYIEMAQLRYPNSICYVSEFAPEIAYVRLPPLLLHNFIENIVKHVVEQGVLTEIRMTGTYENRVVTFTITDDGPGMDAETLTRVVQNMRQTEISGKHVGMANAYRRLKYFYGEEADIKIWSELGAGTVVKVIIPYDLEVQNEFINCQ